MPYVFINFGPWNGESVKTTIWSEALGNMSSRPSDSWVGNWISVTGLIDPPYDGRHYGRPYRNVGIAVVSDNQIIKITEREAKFRLGRGGQFQWQGVTEAPKPKNADILGVLRGHGLDTFTTTKTGAIGTPALKSSPPTQPHAASSRLVSKNARILEGVRLSSQPMTASPSYNPPPPTPYKPNLLSRIPIWVWIMVGLAIVRLLARH